MLDQVFDLQLDCKYKIDQDYYKIAHPNRQTTEIFLNSTITELRVFSFEYDNESGKFNIKMKKKRPLCVTQNDQARKSLNDDNNLKEYSRNGKDNNN